MKNFVKHLRTFLLRLSLLWLAICLGCKFGGMAYCFDSLSKTEAASLFSTAASVSQTSNPAAIALTLAIATAVGVLLRHPKRIAAGFTIIFLLSMSLAVIARATTIN